MNDLSKLLKSQQFKFYLKKIVDSEGNLTGIIKKEEKEIREILDNVKGIYKEEQIQALEERIERLKEENESGQLALSYSILADLCKVKAEVLLEDEEVDLDKINDWKKKADHYKQLEKSALLKLDKSEVIRLRNDLCDKILKELIEGIAGAIGESFGENLYRWLFSELCDDCIKKLCEIKGIE